MLGPLSAGNREVLASGTLTGADQVIPLELQRRTWDYLADETGAELDAYRSAGGHGLDLESVAWLAGWIGSTLGLRG